MKSEIGDFARLNHILDAIQLIEIFTKDINPENLMKTNLLLLVVCINY